MILDMENKILKIGRILNDRNRPLKERFRALFTLRNIGGNDAINSINECFKDSSALLKHELAYCLGQMQDARALPILTAVLSNLEEHPMVRHEAGEAIGAIGSEISLDILQKYTNDQSIEVAETCQLAVKRIKWLIENKEAKYNQSPYQSIDPTPAEILPDVNTLKDILFDEKEELFNRYKAMFALRDLNTPESVLSLCEGLSVGGTLFRHEVAFVLGQLQNGISVPYLIKALEDLSQNEMVRHECAEALGALATEQCFEVLRRFEADDSQIVRESCNIALDMAEYESSMDFQYANTAITVDA